MPAYAVETDGDWQVLWVGEAASGSEACARAARAAGLSVGEFHPYDFPPPSHKEDGVSRVVLHAFDLSGLESPHTVEYVRAHQQALLTEDRSAGCFMARQEEE
jgi:hypothetical protein